MNARLFLKKAVVVVVFQLVFGQAVFAAITDKDFKLDDNDAGSPLVIMRDQDENILTLQKLDAGWADIINNEVGINFKPSGDTDDYLQFLTTGDSSYLYWLGVLGYANDPGLRVNPTTGKLEYRDEDESIWTTLDTLGGGVFTLDTATTPDKVYFTDGLTTESADFVFGSDQLDNKTGTADDSRMFFDKSQSVFRAGYTNGAQWDAASVAIYSFASGLDTTASGYGSFASGLDTTASGGYSIAMGYFKTAQAYNSTVLGRYNVISGDISNWVATDPLFVIGNGTGTSVRANAFTVLKNGNVGIGWATPDGKLEVRQTAAADIFNLYDDTTNVFTVLDGGNVGIGTTAPVLDLAIGDTDSGIDGSAGNLTFKINGTTGLSLFSTETQIFNGLKMQSTDPIFAAANLNFGSGNSAAVKMTLDSSGNLGIGTSSPGARLDVKDSLTTNHTMIEVDSSGSGTAPGGGFRNLIMVKPSGQARNIE